MILAGSGRSGTTWLGNILTANPNVRIIFEPFDGRRVPEASVLPLRPYARPGESYPLWEPFIRDVLLGNVENEWTNRQGKRWWANKRLIKAIRINLMLGWMSELFQPRIIYVTRHPCAVVLSRLKLKWETHLDVFLTQPQLVADYLEPYMDVILGAETAVQRHAVMWCVENLVPLRQLPNYDWIFCTYENFYLQPEAEAERVLKALGLRKSWFTRRAIQQVSSVTRADSAIVDNGNPMLEWQRQLSAKDIKAILSIVDAFGIGLYGDEAVSDPNAIQPALAHS